MVGAGLGVLGLLLALWVATRRRRPVKEAAPAVARDAWAEALRGLAQLRALDLPGRGRFGDHALALTSILRRFLEATEGTPRPGDTTSGAVERLQSARIGPQDMRLVVELLRGWDRVKFARAPSTPEEARRAERSVESFVRRRAPSPAQRAA